MWKIVGIILYSKIFCLHLHHSLTEIGQEGWVSGWNHQFAKLTYSIRVPGVRIPLLPRRAERCRLSTSFFVCMGFLRGTAGGFASFFYCVVTFLKINFQKIPHNKNRDWNSVLRCSSFYSSRAIQIYNGGWANKRYLLLGLKTCAKGVRSPTSSVESPCSLLGPHGEWRGKALSVADLSAE